MLSEFWVLVMTGFCPLKGQQPLTTTNRHVKRHLMSASTHEHGSHAEIKLGTTICAHRPNTRLANSNQGPKLYSKVLTIEPNRLLGKCSELNKGAKYRLCLLIVPLLDDRSTHPRPPLVVLNDTV